ncbi:MAG: hypothetical protein ACQER7_12655, partial [Bacteroidota bacterium]
MKTRKNKYQTYIPDNLFSQCTNCKKMVYKKKIDRNQGVCPECGHHMRISNQQWMDILFDEDTVQRLFEEYKTLDVLNFPGYKDK